MCHLQNKCRIPNYFSAIHLCLIKISEVIQISVQNSCWGFWRAIFSLFNANIMKSEQESKTSFYSWISMAFTTLKLYGTDTENLTAKKPATVLAPKLFCFLPLLQLQPIDIFHHSSPAKLLFSLSLCFIQPLLVLQNYSLFYVLTRLTCRWYPKTFLLTCCWTRQYSIMYIIFGKAYVSDLP